MPINPVQQQKISRPLALQMADVLQQHKLDGQGEGI